MKRIFAVVCSFVSLCVLFLGTGCSVIGNSQDNSDKQSSTSTCEIYLDNSNINLNGFAIQVSCSERIVSFESENQSLEVCFKCTNLDVNEKNVMVTDAQILYEEANVIYEVSVYPETSVDLQYGIEHTFTFSATIPKSYKKTNYVLSFSADRDYKIYLYETPDELRKNCTVSFVIDNNVVQEVQVKERRCLSEVYAWETEDHLYHCNKWYSDKSYQNEFTPNKKIEENTILYGRKCSNIEGTYDNIGYYITGIDYVPTDGILVIPEVGFEKIYISNFAIHKNNEIKEIYFPKTLKKIYAGNFNNMPNLEKIHFAGSQEEWDLIEISYSTSIPENVIIVYNSVF